MVTKYKTLLCWPTGLTGNVLLCFDILILELDFHVGRHDAGPLRTALYELLPLPCIEADAADGVDRNAFAAVADVAAFLLSAALMFTHISVGWQLCWQSLLCGNLMYLFKKF